MRRFRINYVSSRFDALRLKFIERALERNPEHHVLIGKHFSYVVHHFMTERSYVIHNPFSYVSHNMEPYTLDSPFYSLFSDLITELETELIHVDEQLKDPRDFILWLYEAEGDMDAGPDRLLSGNAWVIIRQRLGEELAKELLEEVMGEFRRAVYDCL